MMIDQKDDHILNIDSIIIINTITNTYGEIKPN